MLTFYTALDFLDASHLLPPPAMTFSLLSLSTLSDSDRQSLKRALSDNNQQQQTPPKKRLLNGHLNHTPHKSKLDFDGDVNAFLDKCRPKMRKLVENAHDVSLLFPSWKLPNADKDLAEHVAKLAIPVVSGGRPSLLLHNLGEKTPSDSRGISEIFSFAHHTFVHLVEYPTFSAMTL
jgi:hypothetical protein